MFTIRSLLHEAALDTGLLSLTKPSGQPENTYRFCNLFCGSASDESGILWIAELSSLKEAVEKTSGGIVCICRRRTTEKISVTAAESSGRREIAFLCTKEDLPVIFSQLQAYAIRQTTALFDEAAFAESLFQKRTVREVVDQACALLQSPVILTSSSYKVLAMNNAGLKFYDPVWDAAMETGYCSAESVVHFEKEGITSQVLQSQDAFLLDTGLAKKIPRILQKIETFGKVGAYIGVFEVSRRFTESDLKMVDMICRVLSVILEKDEKILRFETEISQSILTDLLMGRISSATILNDRIRSAYWKPKRNFRCAALLPDNAAKGIVNADYLISSLSNEIPGTKVIRTEEGLMALLNFSVPGTRTPYEEILARTGERYGLSIGISNEFRDLIKLKCYYDTALEAVEISRSIHAEKRVTFFCDVIFGALVKRIGSFERTSYEQSKYKLLAEYDRLNGTSFTETLIRYIECGCSSAEASRKLFIHRNTMTHRLEKITALVGIDLKDGRELIHFYLSDQIAAFTLPL